MGTTWGPPGSCRPQMGPMLATWTLLSGGGSHLLTRIHTVTRANIVGFVQDFRVSSALGMAILQFCTKPPLYKYLIWDLHRVPNSRWEVVSPARDRCVSPYWWCQRTNTVSFSMLMFNMITSNLLSRHYYTFLSVPIVWYYRLNREINIVSNSNTLPKSQRQKNGLSLSKSRADMPIYFGSMSPATDGCVSTGSGSQRDFGFLFVIFL